MDRLLDWLDNPILVKHARSRLRRGQLIPAVAVTMVVALCVVIYGYQVDRLHSQWTFGRLVAMQAVLLGVVGANRVGESVSRARDSGIIDFHRASPLPPMTQAFGFFLGAPIREYVLALAILPFDVICLANDSPSPRDGCAVLMALVLVSWTMQMSALLNALLGKPSKTATRGLIVLLVLVLAVGMAFGVAVVARRGLGDVGDEGETFRLNFFGGRFPWLVVLAIDLLPIIGLGMVASARKLAAERAHALSKPQAVAGLAGGAALLVGNLWGLGHVDYLALAVLYAVMAGATIMALTITPNLAEYSKAVRQASRPGERPPSAWSDPALNRVGLAALCLVVLIAPTVAWYAIEEPGRLGASGPASYSLAIAIGVLVVGDFGLALQYFQLRSRRWGRSMLTLFLFSAWVIPLVVGTVSMVADARGGLPGPGTASLALLGLSPVAGIVLSTGIPGLAVNDYVYGCAVMPPLIFAFLFNHLVVAARRKIRGDVLPGPALIDKEEMAEVPS